MKNWFKYMATGLLIVVSANATAGLSGALLNYFANRPSQAPVVKTVSSERFSCNDNLKMGSPSLENESNIMVCRKGYALMFNKNTKTPLWVAEHLTKSEIFGTGERALQFKADPNIPANFQANVRDYARSGYDQGHMAPAADFSQDQQLMDESFYYSNVVPQNPEHNRHIWASLEKKVRTWASKRGELYIVTGPVFTGGRVNQTLGRSQVAIPDAIYKIVYDPNTQRAIAFVIPNQGYDVKQLPDFITTVKNVEKLTGLNFHANLPQNLQDNFENKLSGMWTR